MRVGVCDWGIGGLGFYRLLRESRPDLDVVYLGDQGVPGYGKLPRSVLIERVEAVLRWFDARGVNRVVVACNAASTVLPFIRSNEVVASGMIVPTLDALRGGSGTLGLIGGRRTILSRAYATPLGRMGYAVRGRVAQPLSGIIEAGRQEEPESQAMLREILRPLGGVGTLVLACTHYVVMEGAIRAELSNARLVDPATEAWRRFQAPEAHGGGAAEFFTTGDPETMSRQARLAFDVACEPHRTEVR